ncbi:hypothetical protein SDC9_201616 [bioreactor metagenome]|uniref:Uncharacterized protein n=1 Tax=bioreactor metagenome TaxID=1076179 RepID=A0A645IRU4_9ZZZZ
MDGGAGTAAAHACDAALIAAPGPSALRERGRPIPSFRPFQ